MQRQDVKAAPNNKTKILEFKDVLQFSSTYRHLWLLTSSTSLFPWVGCVIRMFVCAIQSRETEKVTGATAGANVEPNKIKQKREAKRERRRLRAGPKERAEAEVNVLMSVRLAPIGTSLVLTWTLTHGNTAATLWHHRCKGFKDTDTRGMLLLLLSPSAKLGPEPRPSFRKQNNSRAKLSLSLSICHTQTHADTHTHPNTTSVHSLTQRKEVEWSWPGPSRPDTGSLARPSVRPAHFPLWIALKDFDREGSWVWWELTVVVDVSGPLPSGVKMARRS